MPFLQKAQTYDFHVLDVSICCSKSMLALKSVLMQLFLHKTHPDVNGGGPANPHHPKRKTLHKQIRAIYASYVDWL